ncbi:MAG: amidohydrolase family protein, partial [Acidimicrobiia bacterium]
MDPVLLFSSDCHSGVIEQYKEYLDEEYLPDFEQWMGARPYVRIEKDSVQRILSHAPLFFYPDKVIDEYEDQLDERQAWAAARGAERLEILEAEGYVGEVLFPDAGVPFSRGFGGGAAMDARALELQLAGQRAYNRRLFDFVEPSRQVGTVMISYADIDVAVSTVHAGADAGMRGVLLDGPDPSYPVLGETFLHESYEPLWSAIEETGLVAHFHVGAGAPIGLYARPEVPHEVAQIEVPMFGHRALWWLIWGGVLERHPGLKFVFTEQGTSWVAPALKFMDWQWDGLSANRYTRRDMTLPMRPSDYWKRQCFSGASLMSIEDLNARDVLDPSTIMYGTDYAHPEGTWMRTLPYLRAAFNAAGCTEAEVRMICGENAVRCYGFDMDVLAPVAERVGPSIDAL